MKYYRNLFSHLKVYVTTPMRCPSKFSSYVTIISNFSIVIINNFCTYITTVTLLKKKLLFFIHYEIFIKMFFHYFSTIFILFKNCSNKFISCIFISINNNQLTKFIINTNNFISKTTRNVILIFFRIWPS